MQHTPRTITSATLLSVSLGADGISGLAYRVADQFPLSHWPPIAPGTRRRRRQPPPPSRMKRAKRVRLQRCYIVPDSEIMNVESTLFLSPRQQVIYRQRLAGVNGELLQGAKLMAQAAAEFGKAISKIREALSDFIALETLPTYGAPEATLWVSPYCGTAR